MKKIVPSRIIYCCDDCPNHTYVDEHICVAAKDDNGNPMDIPDDEKEIYHMCPLKDAPDEEKSLEDARDVAEELLADLKDMTSSWEKKLGAIE